MRRLNGMDAYLLYSETPNLHSHTLKVAVIERRAKVSASTPSGHTSGVGCTC